MVIQIDRSGHTWPAEGTRRTGFFVDLNGSLVSIDTNDFTDQHIMSDMALTIPGSVWAIG